MRLLPTPYFKNTWAWLGGLVSVGAVQQFLCCVHFHFVLRAFKLNIFGCFSDHSRKLCISWSSSDWH